MKFTSIRLQDFRCFRDFTIEFDPKYNVHVILAENMAGKSALLRAIRICMYDAISKILQSKEGNIPNDIEFDFLKNNNRIIGKGPIKKITKSCTLETRIISTQKTNNIMTEYFQNISINQHNKLTEKNSEISSSNLLTFRNIYNYFGYNKNNNLINPIYLSISVNYIQSNFDYSVSAQSHFEFGLGYIGALTDFNRISMVERYQSIITSLLQEDESIQKTNYENFPKYIEKTTNVILCEIFNFSEYKLSKVNYMSVLESISLEGNRTNEVRNNILSFTFKINRREEWRRFEDLSDGYKYIICLVSELIVRSVILNQHNPEGINERITGIVAIDEFGIHLHPELQKHAISVLSKYFPEVQFIITTHSPMLIGGLEKEQIHILEVDENGDRTVRHPEIGSVGLGVDGILQEMFGLSSTLDQKAEELIKRYKKLINKKNNEGLTREEENELSKLINILGKFHKTSEQQADMPENDPLVKAVRHWLDEKRKSNSSLNNKNQEIDLESQVDAALSNIFGI